jgi:class 3 adenylate cyclase
LVQEKDKSENLLENVLPKGTADELKVKGSVSKKKYDLATVLFSDIQGFTKLAEQMNPETLIDQLDHFFLYFDSVVEKYNIEKIKTIGDAYMCAGGIPEKNRTNPVEVVMAALEMKHFMTKMHEKANLSHEKIWDIRIGIHTGPVIAGVVGHKKLSYDIWGDTVNTASRMESSGEAGKINISGSTYDMVKDFFDCEHRGKMPVKYKGEIDMYFVECLKTEFLGEEGMPNDNFFTKLQLLKMLDLEDKVIKRFKEENSSAYYFHNLDFIKNTNKRIDVLGKKENISAEDLLLLKTSVSLYTFGFLLNYKDAANSACEFAKGILLDTGYTNKQITTICKFILAAHYPYKPKTLSEKIFCDATLEYLGKKDYKESSMNLFKELKENNRINSLAEWKVHQTTLIGEHNYFTETARELREVDKDEQLKMVFQLMENS